MVLWPLSFSSYFALPLYQETLLPPMVPLIASMYLCFPLIFAPFACSLVSDVRYDEPVAQPLSCLLFSMSVDLLAARIAVLR